MKNDQLSETILNEETVYQGKFLKVTHAEVSLPNGHTSGRDMVRHPGGVVIVAIGEEDEVYLEHQYRTPLDTVIVELPAGKREPGEAPELTARRELKEETGLVARHWEKLERSLQHRDFPMKFCICIWQRGLRGKRTKKTKMNL